MQITPEALSLTHTHLLEQYVLHIRFAKVAGIFPPIMNFPKS